STRSASSYWPTHSRTPAARTATGSATSAGRVCMCGDAGVLTSSFHTAAKAGGYISADPPKISVEALLELARWCQQRLCAQSGGDSCPTNAAALSPPTPDDLASAGASGPAVAAAGGGPAGGPGGPAQPPAPPPAAPPPKGS